MTTAAQLTEVPLHEAVSERGLSINLHIHTRETRQNKWNCTWEREKLHKCMQINVSKFKSCIMFTSTTVVSTGY
jgi:hypothetical protein